MIFTSSCNAPAMPRMLAQSILGKHSGEHNQSGEPLPRMLTQNACHFGSLLRSLLKLMRVKMERWWVKLQWWWEGGSWCWLVKGICMFMFTYLIPHHIESAMFAWFSAGVILVMVYVATCTGVSSSSKVEGVQLMHHALTAKCC